MNRKTYAGIRKEKEKDTIVKTAKIPVHTYICTIIIILPILSLSCS